MCLLTSTTQIDKINTTTQFKKTKNSKRQNKREKQNINKAKVQNTDSSFGQPIRERERESSFGQGPGGQPIRERERELLR